jgi:hypothetical protein
MVAIIDESVLLIPQTQTCEIPAVRNVSSTAVPCNAESFFLGQ